MELNNLMPGDEVIEKICNDYSEKLVFQTEAAGKILDQLEGIIAHDEYKKVEPLISELMDAYQQQAFKYGFKAGMQFAIDSAKA